MAIRQEMFGDETEIIYVNETRNNQEMINVVYVNETVTTPPIMGQACM